MKALQFFFATLLLLTGTTFAQERVTVTPSARDPILDTRLGFGAMLGPNLVGLTGSVEVRPDRFVAIGPALDLGFSSNTTIYVPTLGVRFILPASVMKERVSGWPNLEISLRAGAGWMVRSAVGFSFKNFTFEGGLDVDYFIIDCLTVGIGGKALVTSSSVERTSGLLFASAGYHF
ncbi:MAG: hypothetical protein V1495_02905 [Pseudomonadota bacterium]